MLQNIEDETYVRRWPTWNAETMAQSEVLQTKSEFLQLWVWLPPGCHIGDYRMLFATHAHGYKLSELYTQCQGQSNLLIVVQTVKGEVFGAFVSTLDDPEDLDGQSFAPLKHRVKDAKILLFQLRPKTQCFWADTADQFYHQSNFQLKNMRSVADLDLNLTQSTSLEADADEVDADDEEEDEKKNGDGGDGELQRIPTVFAAKEALTVGDGRDDCIYLDADLNLGVSAKCATFGCPPLVSDKNGDFQVAHVEVWSVSDEP